MHCLLPSLTILEASLAMLQGVHVIVVLWGEITWTPDVASQVPDRERGKITSPDLMATLMLATAELLWRHTTGSCSSCCWLSPLQVVFYLVGWLFFFFFWQSCFQVSQPPVCTAAWGAGLCIRCTHFICVNPFFLIWDCISSCGERTLTASSVWKCKWYLIAALDRYTPKWNCTSFVKYQLIISEK